MTNNTTADTTAKGEIEPVAWIRFCKDGLYEGPIHDNQMDDIRRRSGVWTPLVPKPHYDTLRAQLEAAEREVGQLHMLVKQREAYAIEKSAETLVAIRRAEAAEDDAERWAFVAGDHSTAWADEIDEEIAAAKAATP